MYVTARSVDGELRGAEGRALAVEHFRAFHITSVCVCTMVNGE